MILNQAKARLNKLLIHEGININCPHPLMALKAFKAFAKESVECAGELYMFQCGVFSFSGKRLFYLVFVRQFTFYKKLGRDQNVQLYIEFTCEPNESLTPLSTILWAEDLSSMELYFEKIENSNEFNTAITESSWDCKVHQEAIPSMGRG
jgi:hypothetical protein